LPFLEKFLGSSGGEERRFFSAIFFPLGRQEDGFFTKILESSGKPDGRFFVSTSSHLEESETVSCVSAYSSG
jgi:hypothetical protein